MAWLEPSLTDADGGASGTLPIGNQVVTYI